MADAPPPSLRLRIDTKALANNWRALDRLSGEASAGAAIKADCYGLGIDTCLPVLRDGGARDFYVAHWSEVEAALEHIPASSLSVLHGPMTDADVAFAIATGVRPVLNSLEQVQRWLDAGGGTCDLMVDTGINRLGLSMSEIGDPRLADLQIDTLMSHLACADEDSDMNTLQLTRFREATARIPARRRSLANSAGIALGSEYAFDLTRPGLALYGGIPRTELAGEIAQVARLDAAIMQVRQIEAGDSVGYNATFTAQHSMRIGVVSLGYADGFLRSWGGRGKLQHDGHDVPLLGKVSMDMVVVDLSGVANVGEGDFLEVPYALPEAAATSGLSQYELLTVIGRRLRG